MYLDLFMNDRHFYRPSGVRRKRLLHMPKYYYLLIDNVYKAFPLVQRLKKNKITVTNGILLRDCSLIICDIGRKRHHLLLTRSAGKWPSPTTINIDFVSKQSKCSLDSLYCKCIIPHDIFRPIYVINASGRKRVHFNKQFLDKWYFSNTCINFEPRVLTFLSWLP